MATVDDLVLRWDEPPLLTRLIRRLRQSPHFAHEGGWIYYHDFELDLETGIGVAAGQGDDPQIMLQMSDDGGHTWSSEQWVSAGRIGQFGQRAVWRRLGRSQDRTFRVVVTDPVKWALIAAYLDIEVGRS